MSILAALNSAYERLALKDKVPSFGFSNQKVSYLISLNPDGSVAGAPWDLRDISGKTPVAVQKQVPQPPKKTSGVAPNYLWGDTAYVLGVAEAGKTDKNLAKKRQAFMDYHVQAVADTKDEGLQAFLAFLKQWTPESFAEQDWPDDIKKGIPGQNVIFALESERQHDVYLHHRPVARSIWARLCSEEDKKVAVCLVTGHRAPVARLHPSVKGVWDAQPSGASIVSYNKDSFVSYGHEQGDNAPVSEAAAFGYTTALNKFLEKGSHNRIQIGDATTLFWADASEAAETAEAVFASLFGADIDEELQAKAHLLPILERIRNGQRLDAVAPGLAKGVRFYVLGLAPNASRLSIRFWMEDTFGTLMENYQRFLSDMRVDPADHNDHTALWQYLLETAVLGKRENVPPTLAGEWMRAILTGTNYPYTLLSTVLMRIRADGHVNARRVAILKSILVRNLKMKGVPVAFDPDNRNKGYLLGRLFALYEQVQRAALGDKVNATIKDKFYGSASAQPRKVFALLESGSANHLSKIGKQNMGRKVNLEKQIADIMGLMTPGEDPFPASLSAEQQALFGLGYYHQRSEFFKSTTTATEKESA